MNPLFGIRAVAVLAMPVAVTMRGFEQRRLRRRMLLDSDRTKDPVGPACVAAPLLPRRRLRAIAIQHGDLSIYDLRRAQLGRLHLPAVDLAGMDLTSATFRRSNLAGALFIGSVLDHADLSSCDLRGADLSGASLIETDLAAADLRGADLTGCRCARVINLRGARYDHDTRWPAGFDPRDTGAVFTRG